MTNDEKIALIKETLEIESVELTSETRLADIEEYDSMAKLSLIVLFDEKFGRKLTGEKIRSLITIGDIINMME